MGNNIKPFIAVPVYGNVDVHFFAALMEFMGAAKTFPHELHFLYGDSLVSRARNTLTMRFLKSGCTHLLFIDSDLVFSLDHVKRIVSHGEDIVGGFYPKKKQGDLEFVFNCLTPPGKMDDRRLTPVKYMGTGFLCISKKVFETMISELGDELVFKVDTEEKVGFDFWPVGVYKFKDGSRRYLSEDWFFCQRAIDLGFNVYGDNGICLKHSGGAVYPLLTQESSMFVKPGVFDEELMQDVANYDVHFHFNPDTILDIGANVGAFSAHCLKKWPRAKILAYEPVPDNFSKLVTNCPNVEAFNAAVRGFDGSGEIKIGLNRTTCSFLDIGEQTSETVPVKCVDAATLPSCHYVKIDTEGCEVEILSRLDLSKTSLVVCEYHTEEDFNKLEQIANDKGFIAIGWHYFREGLGLLKFVKESNLNNFRRHSEQEAAGSAVAAPSPTMAAAQI